MFGRWRLLPRRLGFIGGGGNFCVISVSYPCINNDSNPASLILGKVYRRLPDVEAENHEMLRIIDEDTSEPEGYLYPASIFTPIELPESVKKALMTAGD